MTRSTALPPPDYYEILNLPFSESSRTVSKQQVKGAYHKALLQHHPDKASHAIAIAKDLNPTLLSASSAEEDPDSPKGGRPFTIDEITTAYRILSDPSLRAEYDRSLRLDRARALDREKTGTAFFHTGLEVVDLEDFECDEGDAGADGEVQWYRGCRCGDERGFLVRETELEREAEQGEIVVGCRGCSLWVKVLFAVQDEDCDGDCDCSGHGQEGSDEVGLKT